MTTTHARLRAILVTDYPLAAESLTLEVPLADPGIDSLGACGAA